MTCDPVKHDDCRGISVTHQSPDVSSGFGQWGLGQNKATLTRKPLELCFKNN